MIAAAASAQPPALVYAARYYDPRPKVRTYSHLYLWRVGQKGRGQILTTGAFDDTKPQASHDGKTVYFVRTKAKKPPAVCALDLPSGKVQALYSATAPSAVIDCLQISPRDDALLVHQSVFSSRSRSLYDQWARLYAPPMGKPSIEALWNGQTYNKKLAAAEAEKMGLDDAVWADNGHVVYRIAPRDESEKRPPIYRYSVGAETNHVTPEGEPLHRSLEVDARLARLNRDLSPDGAWILGQPSWSVENPKGLKFAQPVLIDENDFGYAPFAAVPDETFYWLSDTRLVGIAPDKNGTPTQLHFFDFSRQRPKPGAVPPLPPVHSVELHLGTNAQIVAALKQQGEIDLSNLYEVNTVPNRNDGFILGTPWHRGDRGVRVWINVQTGAATLWSKCGPPHPSSSGTHFWEQPGSGFASIGNRKNGTRITEPILGLNVASYADPARLIPVVSGAAWTNGADWLPSSQTPAPNGDTAIVPKVKHNKYVRR